MAISGLPSDVDAFMEWIGQNVRLCGGDLDWVEQARIKADMMNVRARWYASRVTPDALRDKCEALGLRAEDIAAIVGWLGKVQAGRRLAPHRDHRGYRWPQDPKD